MRSCIHFVDFKDLRYEKPDERFWNAVKIFGWSDYFHKGWDLRAKREIADGDTIIFARGSESQTPRTKSYNDEG